MYKKITKVCKQCQAQLRTSSPAHALSFVTVLCRCTGQAHWPCFLLISIYVLCTANNTPVVISKINYCCALCILLSHQRDKFAPLCKQQNVLILQVLYLDFVYTHAITVVSALSILYYCTGAVNKGDSRWRGVYPQSVSSPAASEGTTPRHSHPSRLDNSVCW